jgi:hypothetical protein
MRSLIWLVIFLLLAVLVGACTSAPAPEPAAPAATEEAAASAPTEAPPAEEPAADAELPAIVHELQGADKMIALTAYPERVLMSPLAYLGYDWMCREGALNVGDLRDTWQLSAEEARTVIQELAGVYFWSETEGQLKPFPAQHTSDMFHGTGIIRAAITGVPLTVV